MLVVEMRLELVEDTNDPGKRGVGEQDQDLPLSVLHDKTLTRMLQIGQQRHKPGVVMISGPDTRHLDPAGDIGEHPHLHHPQGSQPSKGEAGAGNILQLETGLVRTEAEVPVAVVISLEELGGKRGLGQVRGEERGGGEGRGRG